MATQISIDDCMPDSFLNRVRRFIEPDDRRQICRMGLLYAVRTWRAGMIPFEVYARRCISAILKREERLYRDANRAEARLSLDMPVGYEPGTKTTYADIIAAYEDDYSAIEVNDFLQRHQRELKRGGYAALRNEAAAYSSRDYCKGV